MIHPLVLGSGHRLFGLDDQPHRLRLVNCTPTTTRVLMATPPGCPPDLMNPREL